MPRLNLIQLRYRKIASCGFTTNGEVINCPRIEDLFRSRFGYMDGLVKSYVSCLGHNQGATRYNLAAAGFYYALIRYWRNYF